MLDKHVIISLSFNSGEGGAGLNNNSKYFKSLIISIRQIQINCTLSAHNIIRVPFFRKSKINFFMNIFMNIKGLIKLEHQRAIVTPSTSGSIFHTFVRLGDF